MIDIDDNDHLGREEQVDLCQAERTTNVLHSWSPEDHHHGVDDHYHDHDKNYRENILVVTITIITVINITDMVTYSYSSLWNDNESLTMKTTDNIALLIIVIILSPLKIMIHEYF